MTKIMIMNLPSGPYPTDFPPVAVSRVIEGIDPALGAEAVFLDLDYGRRTLEQIGDAVAEYSPRIIGFSAILTPGYKYLKSLSLYLNGRFPRAVQVLGGEMGAIANIVLRRTKIDFCVIGDSEPTFSRLIALLQRSGFRTDDRRPFKEIKELAFLLDGEAYFTGYDDSKRPEVKQVNYGLLGRFTNVDHYMQPVDGQFYRNHINRHHLQHFYSGFLGDNASRKMICLFASQGCVGRCTYCHRYFKGYRIFEPSGVIRDIEEACARYDVGLIQFSEENFGYSRAATKPIMDFLAAKKLNWATSSVRAETLKEEVVREWKAAGCVHLGFGIESCSEKILRVMEKRITVEQNLNAIRLCGKYGIFSQIDLVIGLPGETHETVQETIDALATVLPEDILAPYEVCIQWFQAVPGTMGYEYARSVGRVGPTLDDEEKYVLGLYEQGANDISHYLNFTDYQVEEIAYWKEYIFFELMVAYMRKHGPLRTLLLSKAARFRYAALYMLLPRAARRFVLKYAAIVRYLGFARLLKFLLTPLPPRQERFSKIDVSLRKLVKENPLPVRDDDKYTHPLREGR